MKRTNLRIRRMKRPEIDVVIDWAEMEGWNPGIHDADALYAADPNGMLIGYSGNDPIAMTSAIKYDSNFGFMGFQIIPPEYRGKGYSLEMTQHAMKYLEGLNIGIDGVMSLRHKYELLGFVSAWVNIRFVGNGRGITEGFGKEIVRLEEIDFEVLDEYDAEVFGHQRSEFLSKWIYQPEGLSIGYVYDGKLCGYGVLRKCKVGFKIGPLYADSNQIASDLFYAMANCVPKDERIYIDVPSLNPVGVSIAKGHGMNEVFRTLRMYSSYIPDIPIAKWFGITCNELG